jgi:membrane dipeptidase
MFTSQFERVSIHDGFWFSGNRHGDRLWVAREEKMSAPAVSPENLAKAKAILDSHPSIDLHSHLGLWESKGLSDVPEPFAYIGDAKLRRNVEDMVAARCKCVSVNLTSDVPIFAHGKPGNKARDYQGDEAWQEYQRQMSLLHGFFECMPLEPVTVPDDIEPTFAKGKLAVLLSTEGGHMVEDDLGRMEQLFRDGIRKFQPIHYVHTRLGDNQTDPPVFRGLSPLGKESVKEAVKLGMVVDAAHASFDATEQMADAAGVPIVLSHTLMKYDSGRFGSYFENRPRWITKDHASLVAQTGGVIGTWLMGDPLGAGSAEAFVEAVMRMVETIGIDHVGWATDLIDAGLGPWFHDYSEFPALCARFLDAGFSEEDLAKFVGGNALRVQRQAAASAERK